MRQRDLYAILAGLCAGAVILAVFMWAGYTRDRVDSCERDGGTYTMTTMTGGLCTRPDGSVSYR